MPLIGLRLSLACVNNPSPASDVFKEYLLFYLGSNGGLDDLNRFFQSINCRARHGHRYDCNHIRTVLEVRHCVDQKACRASDFLK